MRIVAFFIFIFFIPFLLVIWILIFITSKENKEVIFKQIRLGKNKKEFIIYKFKTIENQKITTLGKYLRKTGVDEIPQLINIFKNEMDFVGPRPLTKFDVDRLNWNSEKHNPRWNVNPGLTGLAQLSTICNADLSLEKDLFYVENKSFFLDCKLILKSLLIPIFGKNKTTNNK